MISASSSSFSSQQSQELNLSRNKLNNYLLTRKKNAYIQHGEKKPLIAKLKQEYASPTASSINLKFDSDSDDSFEEVYKSDSSSQIKNISNFKQPKPLKLVHRPTRSRFASKPKPKPKVEAKKVEQTDEDSDELINEEDSHNFRAKPRVDRFLSIVEIPQEILYFAQQKFAMTNQLGEDTKASDSQKESNDDANKNKMENIEEEDEDAENDDENDAAKKESTIKEQNLKKKLEAKKELEKRKQQQQKLKKSLASASFSSNTFRFFTTYNGSSLTQEHKKEIIKEIIDNFDLDKYLDEFKSNYYVEIKFDKNKAEYRPARQRLIHLMKSDVIKINDANYMKELSNRIEDMQQEKLNQKIEQLKENERKRQTKLIVKGFIDKPYDSSNLDDDEEERVEINRLNAISKNHSNLFRSRSSGGNSNMSHLTKQNTSADKALTSYRLPKIN